MIIPVLTGKELLKYWRKNIPVIYLPKIGYLLAKNLKGVSDHFEIWRALRFCGALKKPENNVLAPGPLHCENRFWNMKIFAFFFSLSKYLELCFCRSHSTRPTIFFTSFLQPAGIATDSFENRSSAYGRVQLVPKYISKVKLNRGYSPNILSEIMRFQENGSRGKHFAQFP